MGQEGDERGPTGTRGDAERPPRGAAPWACGAFWGVSDFQELLLNIPKVLPTFSNKTRGQGAVDPAGDISSAMGKPLRDGIGEQTPRASPCRMGAHPAPADHRLFQAVKIKEKTKRTKQQASDSNPCPTRSASLEGLALRPQAMGLGAGRAPPQHPAGSWGCASTVSLIWGRNLQMLLKMECGLWFRLPRASAPEAAACIC